MAARNSQSEHKLDEAMVHILDGMLERDETITARSVARLHPKIGHASTITRDPSRSDLLAKYQEKQKDIRKHVSRQSKVSKKRIADQLASKDQRIAELERDLDILRASHLAMIRAVGELGGMSKWMQFFEHFKEIPLQLSKWGAMPVSDNTELVIHKPRSS